jgi:23S rRNA (guanosine2251-2'-O)-methyltransferase
VTNLANALRELKEKGVWIGGLARTEAISLYDADLTGPLALVVGGEEKGIRPLVRSHCDFGLAIPQAGPVDSLNASVAGAVALYEAYRQRRTPSP